MLSFGRRFAMFVVVLGLTSRVAQAGVVITIQQVGSSEVDVTGSGSLNLTALTLESGGSFLQPPDLIPFDAEAVVGTTAGGNVNGYSGISGPPIPPGFGSGVSASGSVISGSGAIFGVEGSVPDLLVPVGYTSGSDLGTSKNAYSGSLSDLGLTPGTYTWTWGSGTTADSLTVNILPAGVGTVPEPSTVVLAASAVACVTYGWTRHRRHQRRQVAA